MEGARVIEYRKNNSGITDTELKPKRDSCEALSSTETKQQPEPCTPFSHESMFLAPDVGLQIMDVSFSNVTEKSFKFMLNVH